jgi:hypothetical protein
MIRSIVVFTVLLLFAPPATMAQTINIQVGTGSTSEQVAREVLERLLQILPPVQSSLSVLGGPSSSTSEILFRLEALLSGLSPESFASRASTTPSLVSGVSCPVITRLLTIGSRGDDVTALQTYFIASGHLTIEAPTGYFGAATQAAVQAWQSERGIVTSGTPETTGFGAVGPMTREALQNCTA